MGKQHFLYQKYDWSSRDLSTWSTINPLPGITADIKTIFRLGGFSVLRIKILDAEKIQLLKATRGEAFADKFTQLLECLEFLGQKMHKKLSAILKNISKSNDDF